MSQASPSFVLVYYFVLSVLLCVPAVPIMLWLRHYVRRHVTPVPESIRALWALKVLRGLALGLALFGVSVLPAWLAGSYAPESPGWQLFAGGWPEAMRLGAAGLTGLFVFQAAYEELLFRGIALPLFGLLLLWIISLLAGTNAQERGRQLGRGAWAAAGVAAALVIASAFAGNHANNPSISTLGLINIALAGLLLGLVAWTDGDIWGAWGLHFCWNFAQALCGLPVSGIRINAHGPITGAAPGLLTGGAFGLEASVSATFALCAALALVLWRLGRICRAARPHGDYAEAAATSQQP